MIERPQPGEYAPYTVKYFDRVPDGDILAHLADGPVRVTAAFDRVPEGQFGTPMAPGEWAPAAVLQHIIDDERIYCYRVLRAAGCARRHDRAARLRPGGFRRERQRFEACTRRDAR
jgi:hypothetical protein